MIDIGVVGHSLINLRQWGLFKKIGELDLAKTLVIAPSRWHDEQGEDAVFHNYKSVHLESIGYNINTFRLRGLRDYITSQLDLLYIEEEPYTILARECQKIAIDEKVPYALFTWENIADKSFGKQGDGIESEVIAKAAILVAGNEGAKARLIYKGADEDKIAICPQTGISDIFKPMPEVEKSYDVAYFGRMVKEKGIEYIEKVAKELNLKMLWVGGRGDMRPSYGDYVGWVDYLKLPKYYNMTKGFVTYPYDLNGYSEQYNYTIGEAMACGTPVISSNNGSISDVYGDAPIVVALEANKESLETAIGYTLRKSDRWREEGITWVHDNLGIDVIARRLLKIFEG